MAKQARGGTPPPAGGNSGPRPCAACGGAVALSHKEHVSRDVERRVFRCRGCGATTSHDAPRRSDDENRRAVRSRRVPIDEGPPEHFVIDPSVAATLLAALTGDETSESVAGDDAGPKRPRTGRDGKR